MLFKLIVTQPKLLLAHATHYADLVFEALQHAFITWKLLLLLYVLSVACLGLSALSTVGALLLWGALPTLNPDNSWVLVVLPMGLLVAGLIFYEAAKRYQAIPVFDEVQQQLKLDMLAIRQAQEK